MLCTVFLAEEMSVRKAVTALASNTLQGVQFSLAIKGLWTRGGKCRNSGAKTRKVADRRTSFHVRSERWKTPSITQRAETCRLAAGQIHGLCRYRARGGEPLARQMARARRCPLTRWSIAALPDHRLASDLRGMRAGKDVPFLRRSSNGDSLLRTFSAWNAKKIWASLATPCVLLIGIARSAVCVNWRTLGNEESLWPTAGG